VYYRVDTISVVGSVKRTPQGGLEVPANLTRTGVLTYRRADGGVQRELRLPDEVFSSASLDTLRGAPLTVGHPGLVTPETYSKTSVGHVADDVRADNQFVAAKVRVQESKAVKAVESKALKELSCGYTCDIEVASGEYQGEKYDAIQRNIRYNHVALLPVGGGRAGSEVALRLDGSAYTYGMDLTVLQAENDRLKGELAGAQARLDALEKLDIDALVADRVALREDASIILGKDLPEGDLVRAACAKAYPSLKLDDKSDDYLRGLFVAAVDQAKKSQAAVAKTNVRVDAAVSAEDKVAAARKRNADRAANAWQGGK